MRIDAMRLFIEVADMGMILKVAKKNNIPQQTIGSMLGTMEEELEAKLFYRKNGQMLLTEEGAVFYQYCNNFFDEINLLEDHDNMTEEQKTLRIATQNNLAQNIIPDWIGILLKIYPNLSTDVQVKSMRQVVSAVQNDLVDIGFIAMFDNGLVQYPELPDDLEFVQLFSGRPYYWLNQKNPIAKNGVVTRKLLSQSKVIFDGANDEELTQFIYQNHFQIQDNLITTINHRMILKLLKEDMALCPDIKINRGELTLDYLLSDRDDIIALPLSTKDSFHVIAGYLTKKEVNTEWLQDITQYLYS